MKRPLGLRGGAGWPGFFRALTARGLTGVDLIMSDAHAGPAAAIGATLPAATWQRLAADMVAGRTFPAVTSTAGRGSGQRDLRGPAADLSLPASGGLVLGVFPGRERVVNVTAADRVLPPPRRNTVKADHRHDVEASQ